MWLREWTSPVLSFAALDRWLVHYNASYLHSALGYPAPSAFEAEPRPRHSHSGSLLNREQVTCESHEALALARQLATLAIALCHCAMLNQLRREVQLTEELSETLTALSTEQGFAYWPEWRWR